MTSKMSADPPSCANSTLAKKAFIESISGFMTRAGAAPDGTGAGAGGTGGAGGAGGAVSARFGAGAFPCSGALRCFVFVEKDSAGLGAGAGSGPGSALFR